jgi:hypothetical protein
MLWSWRRERKEEVFNFMGLKFSSNESQIVKSFFITQRRSKKVKCAIAVKTEKFFFWGKFVQNVT